MCLALRCPVRGGLAVQTLFCQCKSRRAPREDAHLENLSASQQGARLQNDAHKVIVLGRSSYANLW